MKWWCYSLIGSSLFLWGCPKEFPVIDAIPPTILPTPQVAPTPTSMPTVPPVIAPPPCSDAGSCNALFTPPPLVGDFYRVEFGPGSKGFGFGPGSKGFPNVAFQVNFNQTLVRADVPPFQIKQATTRLEMVTLEIIQQNERVAAVHVRPGAPQIRFGSYLAPGTYTLRSMAKGNFPSLTMSSGQLEILEGYHAEVRVVLHDRLADPAALDIEILTRNRLVRLN